jgi:hypothetical protein
LEWPYLTWAVFVLKRFYGKRKEEMVRSTHGGTAMENEDGLEEMTIWVTTLPRDFTKSCFKNVFSTKI